MSDDFVKASKLAQASYQAAPVIVLGSGASAPFGLASMSDLSNRLLANITTDKDEVDSWVLVRTALANGDHLELALENKPLPPSLTRKIVAETWQYINEKDREVFSQAVVGSVDFPLSKLLQSLFNSSQTKVDIVTTNYDRVAEYACSAAGAISSTGFYPGYTGAVEGADPITYQRGKHPARTVRIWKVHGSLDWFARTDGTLVSAPVFDSLPPGLQPLIVTPGLSKFERTYEEPFRTAVQGADRALEQAAGFLCVGYGFRDTHVQPKLVARCRQKNVPVAVVARTLTDEAKTFLSTTAGTSYLGVEKDGDGTRFYMADAPSGFTVPSSSYWSFDGFLDLVLS